MHVKASALTPEQLTATVAANVRTLKERYHKPVLIVETGYYNDRQIEANQWLCDLLTQLVDAGADGLYYWEPELTDDYDLGAWNPRTRKPTLALEAFLGVRHSEPGTTNGISAPLVPAAATLSSSLDAPQYYTPSGVRIASPQRGLNIMRRRIGNTVTTYKVYR